MTFNTDEKLFELFKKHMLIHTSLTDEEVSDYIFYNLEYCNWYMVGEGRLPREPSSDGEIRIGEDWAYKGHFLPLNIFYGQDDAMRKVESDFIDYLTTAHSHAIACIAAAIQQMEKEKIIPVTVQIPRKWGRILPGLIFGLLSTEGAKPRIFSEAKYGRFVEFTF